MNVILICYHGPRGAMGLVLNQKLVDTEWGDIVHLFLQSKEPQLPAQDFLWGGPVEMGRAFFLHTSDYQDEETNLIAPNICLTPGKGMSFPWTKTESCPKDVLTFLGCAAWKEGQLEEEIADHEWLSVPATEDLVFHTSSEKKWKKATQTLSFSINNLSGYPGEA